MIDNTFKYQMLSRLQSDCEYFLNCGKGNIKALYYGNIEEHIAAMKKIWNEFPEEGDPKFCKPEWLSFEEIEEYEKQMLSYTN